MRALGSFSAETLDRWNVASAADELARKRFTGELRNLDSTKASDAAKKSALLILLSVNPHENLSQGEAAIIIGITRDTLRERMRSHQHGIYNGLHIGQ